MGLSDFVSVAVAVVLSRTVITQTFNVPLVVGFHSHWPQRSKTYSTQGLAAALVADGFATGEATYKAAITTASQQPAPGQIVIGRRANKPLQTITLTIVDSTTGNLIGFTLVGSDGASHAISYTIPSASTPTTVGAAVAALINAISGASTTIGTVTAATGVITIARTDGTLTDVQGWQTQSTLNTAVTLADVTADPGIAADLIAIFAANTTGWYGLALDSNSKAEIVAAQAWVESTGQGGKVAFYSNSDSADTTSATTDVFSALQTASYQKCLIHYNGQQLLNYMGAAMAGLLLAKNPGSYTASYKSVVGPPADTDATLSESQALILNSVSTSTPGNGGKSGNYYKVQGGVPFTTAGACPNGQWFDNIVFIDWLVVNLQAAGVNVLLGADKTPLTDYGIGKLKDAYTGVLLLGASPQFGGLDRARPIVVTVPTVASLSSTNRAQRNVPGVTASAFLSGAIQTTQLNVTVSP